MSQVREGKKNVEMKKQNFLLNGKNQFLPTEIEEEKNLDPGKLVFYNFQTLL